MIYDSNIQSLNDGTSALLRTQQQLSSGKRILSPADDPVAAAQVMELSQSQAINAQYQDAQTAAKNNLGLIDGQLSTVTDLLGRIRELGVQAGSASLSVSDRQSIATELRARFDELIGIGNSTDGNGQYLFAGYQSSNKPFAGSVAGGVSYAGDDGQRAVRVSGSVIRKIENTNSFQEKISANTAVAAMPGISSGIVKRQKASKRE
jgi:flagellar hook-associated protein 3 FlgL